ncbi:hypothetical protein Dda_6406 [Drechslerella dactyloides]|uniref:Thioredoxin domain-containing protein n=1 Tax=Drechslerella dactyloides TaxID=74499 RepID=A0AAD6ITY8_DREDA|nr:hypothetical protein Dda_6406 [Drechslerella dactyloides]
MIKEVASNRIDAASPTETLQPLLETLGGEPLFIFFIASDDPVTNQPWCPDVRAAIAPVQKAFSEDQREHNFATIRIAKEEWKNPTNKFRLQWGLQAIPTLARYSLMTVDGESFPSIRMLVEAECLDEVKLSGLMAAEE